MDRGIWATWYDLPAEGREEALAWIHEIYIPQMLSRPEILWGAHLQCETRESRKEHHATRPRLLRPPDTVPIGNDYLLIFGAPTAHAFFDPSPKEMEEGESAEGKEVLGRRLNTRMCVFTEVARVDGPEVGERAPDLTPGPIVQLGSFTPKDEESEEALCAWFTKGRLPTQEKMAGGIGARKLVSVCGWAKHAIMYEFVSMELTRKNFYGHDNQFPDKREWTDRIVTNVAHAPNSPSLGTRIWPPI